MKKLLIVFCFFSSVNFFYCQAIVSKWPNGKTCEEGTLIDSCFTGKYKYYNEQGILTQEGEFTPASFSNVLVRGAVEQGVDTLTIKKQVIKNASLRTGKWIYYSDEGKKISEGTYLPHAFVEIIRALNPQTSSIEYNYNNELQPVKTGIWKSYTDDGILEQEQTFTEGKEDGLRSDYYLNGNLKAQGIFDELHSRKKGTWKEYDDKGNLSATLKYNDQGKRIK